MIIIFACILLATQANGALIRRTDAASANAGPTSSMIGYGLGISRPSPSPSYTLTDRAVLAMYSHDSNGNHIPSSTPEAGSSSASPQHESGQNGFDVAYDFEDEADQADTGPEVPDLSRPTLSSITSQVAGPSAANLSRVAAVSLAYDDGSWTSDKYDRPGRYGAPAPSPTSTLLQYGNGMPGPPGASSVTTSFSIQPTTANPTLTVPIFLSSSIRLALSQSSPAPAPSSSTCRRRSPTALSSALTSTPAAIIVSVTMNNTPAKRVSMPTALAPHELFDWPPEVMSAGFNKRATATLTLTLKTTIATNTLPSFVLEASRTHAASNPTSAAADTQKSSTPKSTPKSTSRKPDSIPSATGSSRSANHTVDPRCPYPYPGVKCDGSETTLVPRTSKKSSETQAMITTTMTTTTTKKKPTSSPWCPYPGQDC